MDIYFFCCKSGYDEEEVLEKPKKRKKRKKRKIAEQIMEENIESENNETEQSSIVDKEKMEEEETPAIVTKPNDVQQDEFELNEEDPMNNNNDHLNYSYEETLVELEEDENEWKMLDSTNELAGKPLVSHFSFCFFIHYIIIM